MFMPQILPRLNTFYSAGFANLAYLIALVYRAVNILPSNHAVFRKENRTHLGLRLVMGAAASELKFTRSHIDQIVIYFVILLGLILLAAQFFLVLMYVMMNPALANGAMPTTYAQFFSTPIYDKDVAYQLLFRVFGVPEIFGPGKTLRPFHTAIYALFQLYSIGLLVIAVIIISYLIFAIVVETAQTGVPFGKRYNHVWAPIRLVMALGLLIPIGYGLNSAQWITLYAAKFGSDFATKGWITFNQVMTGEYLQNPYERVAKPRSPQMMNLAAFMLTVDACRYAYERYYPLGPNFKDINGYLVKNTADGGAPASDFLQVLYEDAVKFFNNGDIMISFGEYNPTQFGKEVGYVYPYCGSIVIMAGDAKEPGAKLIQEHYYYLVMKMYAAYGGYQDIDKYAQDFVRKFSEDPIIRNNTPLPPNTFKKELEDKLNTETDTKMREAVDAQTKSDSWKKDQQRTIELGWAGAGLWYNKIAEINGSMVTAANNVPQPQKMPDVMEFMKREQLKHNSRLPESFKAYLANGRPVDFNNETEKSIGKILAQVWDWWMNDDINQGKGSNQIKRTNNIFIDAINVVFGTRGLFDMCQSADVHPLAQLSVLGKGLVETSIRNLGLAVGAGALSMLPIPFIGAAAGAASSILLSIVSITITLGFVLFYVLPFMPFLYFFFAVGGWIKGLFEAMVGVPLWALAHLRIDGEGLPGDAAMSGYYLIFEIFLRPILIVFGLLASVIIFAAMVKVLNEIFSLVVVNLAGHDENSRTLCGQLPGGTGAGSGNGTTGSNDAMAYMRGPIDELFFTIIYAIIVYMIGMSCFKLIDLVPNNILRYMNASVNTFNDMADDPAEGLITKLSVGGKFVSGQVMDIGSKAGGAVGKTIEGVQQLADTNPKK